MLIEVTVHAGSSQEKVERRGSEVHVYTHAKAVNNQANESVIELLSKEFEVAKSLITLVRGGTSKKKVFKIEG